MSDPAPLLRGESTPSRLRWGIALSALVGALAAVLVWQGNPGNMGICGACFLRDLAGALGAQSSKMAIFRPEIAGLVLGAFAWVTVTGRFEARSGSHAASRFLLGIWMGIGALVFLGCPFRLLQRLGGGDGTALAGLAGLVGGVGIGTLFEKRGYSVGKTAPAPAAVGLLGPVVVLGLLALYLAGLLPKGAGEGVPHAPWAIALAVAVVAGAILSSTGFCAVSSCRQIFQPGKGMLIAAVALVAGYAAVSLATGKFNAGFEKQPAAHGDFVASFFAMALVGLTGVLAGGCPVRQIVMAGEGNGDALVTAAGIAVGGAVAHNMGLVSTPDGATPAGRWAIGIGLAFALAYAAAVTRAARR